MSIVCTFRNLGLILTHYIIFIHKQLHVSTLVLYIPDRHTNPSTSLPVGPNLAKKKEKYDWMQRSLPMNSFHIRTSSSNTISSNMPTTQPTASTSGFSNPTTPIRNNHNPVFAPPKYYPENDAMVFHGMQPMGMPYEAPSSTPSPHSALINNKPFPQSKSQPPLNDGANNGEPPNPPFVNLSEVDQEHWDVKSNIKSVIEYDEINIERNVRSALFPVYFLLIATSEGYFYCAMGIIGSNISTVC